MAYKAPKAILNHPGVAECNDGEAAMSDYRHDVWLKPGWSFRSGRNAGGRALFCNNVADFRYGNPQPIVGAAELREKYRATFGETAPNEMFEDEAALIAALAAREAA
jgi:hypothetical protein